jgi:hypothetical protein
MSGAETTDREVDGVTRGGAELIRGGMGSMTAIATAMVTGAIMMRRRELTAILMAFAPRLGCMAVTDTAQARRLTDSYSHGATGLFCPDPALRSEEHLRHE